jgi:hypothetical protein
MDIGGGGAEDVEGGVEVGNGGVGAGGIKEESVDEVWVHEPEQEEAGSNFEQDEGEAASHSKYPTRT